MRWLFPSVNFESAKRLAEALSLPPKTAQILIQRGHGDSRVRGASTRARAGPRLYRYGSPHAGPRPSARLRDPRPAALRLRLSGQKPFRRGRGFEARPGTSRREILRPAAPFLSQSGGHWDYRRRGSPGWRKSSHRPVWSRRVEGAFATGPHGIAVSGRP